MDDRLITSVANPLIKRIRALDQRKQREEQGAFFVEGIRPVWLAVESGAPIELVIAAPELLTSEPARSMIEAQRSAGTRVVETTGRVFRSLAAREHPSGLGAIVRIAPAELDELPVGPGSVLVALEQPGNPGNLGTILRTADAAGASGVILIGGGTDPYHPAAVKASMGTLFTVTLARAGTAAQMLQWCRSRGVIVVTTSSRAWQPYWSVQYPRPLLLLFGSEGEGLSDAEVEQGDLAVQIPMEGRADSLNLAVAVGVLLYEVKRQAAVQVR